MAYSTKCPACGREVSNEANTCPGCRFDLANDRRILKRIQEIEEEKNKIRDAREAYAKMRERDSRSRY